MAFSLFGTVFADSVTAIPSAFLNKLRTEMPSAVDGRGGTYTNTSELRLEGAGADVRIGGDSLVRLTPAGGTHIETACRFDSTLTLNSSNYPTFSGRTYQIWELPTEIGNDDSSHPARGIDSGKPVMSFSPRTAANSTLLAIPRGRAPQGSLLVAVYVLGIGISGLGSGTLHYPTYQVQKVALGSPGIASWGALTNLSTSTADAHTSGNWLTNYVETTITVTGSPAITPQSATYQLLVNNPWNSSDDVGMLIAAIGAQYTVTELRF